VYRCPPGRIHELISAWLSIGDSYPVSGTMPLLNALTSGPETGSLSPPRDGPDEGEPVGRGHGPVLPTGTMENGKRMVGKTGACPQ